MSRPIGMATPTVEELEAEIERLQREDAAWRKFNAMAEKEIERLQKECEDKDRVIRAGINTAKRLRAALERIERHCDADSSRIVHEIQVMVREALDKLAEVSDG